MLWLFLFGLVHGYGIWSGDILVSYATCGLLLFWVHKRPPSLLLSMGLLLIAGGTVVSLLGGWSMANWPEGVKDEFRLIWAPDAKAIAKEIAAFRGNWLEQMPHRATTTFFMQVPGFLYFSLWRVGGAMLIGMGLLKNGFLKGE